MVNEINWVVYKKNVVTICEAKSDRGYQKRG